MRFTRQASTRLYYVNEPDIAQMPLTITPERFKRLHR